MGARDKTGLEKMEADTRLAILAAAKCSQLSICN